MEGSAVTDRSPYLTAHEVAEHLRVSEKTVYEMVRRGQLDYVRTGRTKGLRITACRSTGCCAPRLKPRRGASWPGA